MFHNQHESRGVHLSDYIESESDSGMKRFSLQDGQMSNCMLSARFLWYKAIIIKPFLFFPEKSVGYFIAEQNIYVILENFCLCLIQRTLGELPNFGVMIWQLYYMLRSALICFQVTRFRNKGNHFI